MKFRLIESITNVDNLGNELSQEQIQFFKNSKIRDDNGNLMVCYHGTVNPGFTEFSSKDAQSQFGKYKFRNGDIFYFTSSEDIAAGYTEYGFKQNGNIYSCYLNIKNPYIVNNKTEDTFKTWKSIQDSNIRNIEIKKFNQMYKYWKMHVDEDTDYQDINDDLFYFGVCLKPCENDNLYYNLCELPKNTEFGRYGDKNVLMYEYTLEEFFEDDQYDDFRDFVVGNMEEDNGYLYTIDNIINWVLYMNANEGTSYDGVIVPDIFDSGPNGSMFDDYSTIYVAFQSNQIKSISNKTPSNSTNINEEEIKKNEIQIN